MLVSTIAAISTPLGYGGIGIIRISGPQAIEIGQSVFVRGASLTSDIPANLEAANTSCALESNRMVYGHIVDPDSRKILDEVLFVIMRAPHSYTAEDVVEIQAHAGILVLKSILSLLIKKGAVLAEPGEFTKRAFLNGRIDLTQAESVADIINARSLKALDMAMAQKSGEFRQIVESIRAGIIGVLSTLEAAIDFSDEVDEEIDVRVLSESLENQTIPAIKDLIARYGNENFLREGLKVVIVGRPNVGKSSLLNRLVNRERAIVADIPGTTRDFIEDSFITKGIPIIVTDTAGIHENPEPVERIGIKKAWERILSADLILYVLDAGSPVSPEDLNTFSRMAGKKLIIVVNKMDLPREKILFSFPQEWKSNNRIDISARYAWGIDELKDLIAHLAFNSIADKENHSIVPNLRHKTALEKCLSMLTDARSELQSHLSLELAAINLHSSLDALGEITGENTTMDILEKIFSQFCIGK